MDWTLEVVVLPVSDIDRVEIGARSERPLIPVEARQRLGAAG